MTAGVRRGAGGIRTVYLRGFGRGFGSVDRRHVLLDADAQRFLDIRLFFHT